MIAEAIEFIADMARKGQDFRSFNIPNSRQVIVRRPDGECVEITHPPEKRRHQASNLGSFCRMLAGFGNNVSVFVDTVGFADGPGGSDALFVQAFLDSDDRDDTVVMQVFQSRAWTALRGLVRRPANQDELVRTLRSSLFNTVDSSVAAVFHTLDFSRRNDGSRAVSHASDSLGRKVESEVRSKHGDIPEVIVFSLPVIGADPFDLSVTVRCAVEILHSEEKIALHPLGDDFEKAVSKVVERAVLNIKEVASAEGVEAMVVCGTA